MGEVVGFYRRSFMQNPPKKFSSSSAQTITELAIFGALLIFILGVMIRYSLSANYSQSQSFKAMRMAMAASFRSAEAGHSSRNSASLIFIEDRTTAEVGRFGAQTRTPAIAAASATFSKNLLMPLDYPFCPPYPGCYSRPHNCQRGSSGGSESGNEGDGGSGGSGGGSDGGGGGGAGGGEE